MFLKSLLKLVTQKSVVPDRRNCVKSREPAVVVTLSLRLCAVYKPKSSGLALVKWRSVYTLSEPSNTLVLLCWIRRLCLLVCMLSYQLCLQAEFHWTGWTSTVADFCLLQCAVYSFKQTHTFFTSGLPECNLNAKQFLSLAKMQAETCIFKHTS